MIMRKFVLLFIIGLLFYGCKKDRYDDVAISDASNMILKTGQHVAVCHKSGANWNVISVNINSWPAHEAHGDAIDKDDDGYFDRECGCSEVDPDDNNPDIYPGEPGDTCSIITKLIANGPNYDSKCMGDIMGEVIVIDDGNFITITYDVSEENWVFNVTQLYIGPETDIPATPSGNPIPGDFPYINIHEPGVSSFTVGPIPTPENGYVIAAHATVEKQIVITSPDSLCELLPETVDFIFTGKGPESYLNITVSNGDWLNGDFNGWCIDLDHTISDGNLYENADVYCSLEPLPDTLLDHPENIDLINWIINNVSAGQASVSCEGNYTWGDIQRAIWELIDDENTDIGLGEWSQCRADEIVANAFTNGEGFTPECGGYLGVILDTENVQTVLITVPFSCEITLEQTGAWAYGHFGEYCDIEGPFGTSFTDSQYYGGAQWGWYYYGCEQ